MANTDPSLPLPIRPLVRGLDAVTARALRLALWADVDLEDAAAQLRSVAGDDREVLSTALARVERTLAAQWSDIAARAAAELRAARDAA